VRGLIASASATTKAPEGRVARDPCTIPPGGVHHGSTDGMHGGQCVVRVRSDGEQNVKSLEIGRRESPEDVIVLQARFLFESCRTTASPTRRLPRPRLQQTGVMTPNMIHLVFYHMSKPLMHEKRQRLISTCTKVQFEPQSGGTASAA